MADKIVFDYDQIATAVTTINGIADKYATAAQTLQSEVGSAVSTWEGACKIQFDTLFTGDIKTFTLTNIPEMVKSLAELLQGNAEAMKETDDEIAKNIPSTIF